MGWKERNASRSQVACKTHLVYQLVLLLCGKIVFNLFNRWSHFVLGIKYGSLIPGLFSLSDLEESKQCRPGGREGVSRSLPGLLLTVDFGTSLHMRT